MAGGRATSRIVRTCLQPPVRLYPLGPTLPIHFTLYGAEQWLELHAGCQELPGRTVIASYRNRRLALGAANAIARTRGLPLLRSV